MPLEVHEPGAQALLRHRDACQHRGSLRVEPDTLEEHAGEDAHGDGIEPESDPEHPPAPAHRRTVMVRTIAAVSASPRAANATATRSMPSGDRAAWASRSARR